MNKFIDKLNLAQKIIILIFFLTISFIIIYSFPIEFFWSYRWSRLFEINSNTGIPFDDGRGPTRGGADELKLLPLSITLILESCIISFFLFKSKE